MTAIWAIGTMSGTSLDGVDAAALHTDGIDIHAFADTAYRAYTTAEQSTLRAALGKWPGEAGVDAATAVVETAHRDVVAKLKGAVVGFHGQTLAHAPLEGRTHQAGSGTRLAEALGRDVVWDFRSADVALGGQGAPLAPVFHWACARWIKADAPVAFLNLGGVGNLTWVDPAQDDPAYALLAFDTGPANAPLNDLCMSHGIGSFDAEGKLAQSGEVNEAALSAALAQSYYARIPPKSLDRDALAPSLAPILTLSPSDAAATLVALIAETVAQGVTHCPKPPSRVLVTGGGRKNPAIMARLQAALSCDVEPVETVGLDGDMLEAQAFAYLAVRVLRGLPTSFPKTTGVKVPVGGGQISRPLDSAR